MTLKAALAISLYSITSIGLSLNFEAIVRSFYQERIMSLALKTRSIRKPTCRVYSNKGIGTQNAKRLNENLARLLNLVLIATLS